MCNQKLDAVYQGLSINEKENPEERFHQALDEYSFPNSLRAYIPKHFFSSWREVLGDLAKLEKALSNTQSYKTDSDKLACFLSHFMYRVHGKSSLEIYREGELFPLQKERIELAINMAKAFYPNSPYALYNSKWKEVFELDYLELTSLIFAQDFYFTTEFFADPELNSLEPGCRNNILWREFIKLVPPQIDFSQVNPKVDLLPYELIELVKPEIIQGPDTKLTSDINKGYEFLKAWILHDSKAGLPLTGSQRVIQDAMSPFHYHKKHGETNEYQTYLDRWTLEKEKALEARLYLNFDVENLSEEEQKHWAEGLEYHYKSKTDNNSHERTPKENIQKACSNNAEDYLNELVSYLSPEQLRVWVKYTIQEEIKHTIKQDLESIHNSNWGNISNQPRWLNERVYEIWQLEFCGQLANLNIEQKLKTLFHNAPFPKPSMSMKTDEMNLFYQKHVDWWNSLYFQLIDQDSFPKALFPRWTIGARNKKNIVDVMPAIKRSIGILRGELAKITHDESQLNSITQQLAKLLSWVDDEDTSQALRHRLMLMRASPLPLADEGLNYYTLQAESEWYKPLREFSHRQAQHRRCHLGCNNAQQRDEGIHSFYSELAQKISEFCLSRLQLRKNEKVVDGRYYSNQVVEPSALWRQGYLKALGELGFDLHGKVHKTIHFVKQSDEDESVRAIANQTYKIVRRQKFANKSLVDLKRGIIAAEWWLLHSQRHELGLNVNPEEALKTRRRLLRNL